MIIEKAGEDCDRHRFSGEVVFPIGATKIEGS
jgi:hypothetical protein